MNKRYITSLMSLIILFLFCTLAHGTYTQVGNTKSDYTNDKGRFNLVLRENEGWIQSSTAIITEAHSPPLVSDLDGDGTNEIIVIDQHTLKIFQGNTLNAVGSYSIPHTLGGNYSNLITYNIDGDNFTEIIFVHENDRRLHIIEFNSSHTTLQKNFSIIDTKNGYTAKLTAGNVVIGCGETEECMIGMAQNIGGGGGNTVISMAFDSNGKGNSTLIGSTGTMCFPFIRSMAIGDVDLDGEKEYFYTYWNDNGGAFGDVITVGMRVNTSATYGSPFNMLTKIDDRAGNFYGAGSGCRTQIPVGTGHIYFGNAFTSPIIFNADTTTSGGEWEIFVGMITGNTGDTVNIFGYENGGNDRTSFKTFPDSTEGNVVSNLVKINHIEDTGSEDGQKQCADGTDRCDVCMMAYDIMDAGITDDGLRLICGSLLSEESHIWGEYDDSEENIQNFGKPSVKYGSYEFMIHASQQSNQVNTGTHLGDEIITPYGVFFLHPPDYDYLIVSYKDGWLERIFDIPIINATIIMADIQNEPDYADMLVISSDADNMAYIDDQYTNTGGEVVQVCVNPCTDGTWKLNTTVQISVTVDDADRLDLVSGKASIYSGESYEQSSDWTINSSQGTTFTFGNFVANQTTSNGVFKGFGRDNFDPTKISEKNYTFSVSNNGLEYGDCQSCETFVLTTDPTPDDTTTTTSPVPPNPTNAVTSALDTFLDTGIGYLGMWLIIMVAVAFGIWVGGSALEPSLTFGIVIFAEFLLVILGFLFGFISFGVLLVLIIISLAIVSMTLRRMFTGTNS